MPNRSAERRTPMIGIYDLHNRASRRGYEAFTDGERSLGVFESEDCGHW
jgi:hypothetical protein